MGEISPGKEIGIDLGFYEVMKSAMFFHFPCVRSRVHKYEQILLKFNMLVGNN